MRSDFGFAMWPGVALGASFSTPVTKSTSSRGCSLNKMTRVTAVQQIQVRSLGGEDPLEKGMAIYSSVLAWRIPWTGEPGGLQPMGCNE